MYLYSDHFVDLQAELSSENTKGIKIFLFYVLYFETIEFMKVFLFYFYSSPEDMFTDLRERERDIVWERNINLLLPISAPARDWTHHLGVGSDQELNLQPFGVQDHTLTKWAIWQGLWRSFFCAYFLPPPQSPQKVHFFFSKIFSTITLLKGSCLDIPNSLRLIEDIHMLVGNTRSYFI